ncbi:hypothetical protein CR513_17792, partial [Mucuna pruriens]
MFHHVPREENQMVDALTTLSALVQVNEGQEMTIHVRQQPQMAYCQCLTHETIESSAEPWAMLYKRNVDMTLLRCVDSQEVEQIMEEVHEGIFGTHVNGHALARKILRVGYYWTRMESDCCQHVRKCGK